MGKLRVEFEISKIRTLRETVFEELLSLDYEQGRDRKKKLRIIRKIVNKLLQPREKFWKNFWEEIQQKFQNIVRKCTKTLSENL